MPGRCGGQGRNMSRYSYSPLGEKIRKRLSKESLQAVVEILLLAQSAFVLVI